MISVQLTFQKIQRGFTLIELLIVIAILGVLAAAVLSAINPVEQINRGRDTGSLSDAEQLQSAISRFNAAQGYLPWVVSEGTDPVLGWTLVDMTHWVNDAGTPLAVLTLLSNDPTNGTGELLPAYISRVTATSYNSLYVYKNSATGSSVYVCYKPQSGAITTKAKNRCNTSADKPADFPSEACDFNGSGDYYACLP